MVVITLGLIKFQKAIAGNSYRKTPRAWLGLLVVAKVRAKHRMFSRMLRASVVQK